MESTTTTIGKPILEAVVESSDAMAPERIDKCREAFRLCVAGKTQDEIAAAMKISRRTVCRLLDDYREAYRRQLEVTPTLHLISERLARYEVLAMSSLADAEKAKTDSGRKGHRETALKFLRAYDLLALDTGLIPREPTKIYSAVEHLRPASMKDKELPERSREEIIASITRLLRRGRTM